MLFKPPAEPMAFCYGILGRLRQTLFGHSDSQNRAKRKCKNKQHLECLALINNTKCMIQAVLNRAVQSNQTKGFSGVCAIGQLL